VTRYRLEADLAVAVDVEAAFAWYEEEQPNLGIAFLEQLSTAYNRILNNPSAYQPIRSGICRALTRQFPYAIYYVIEDETILVLAVLHTARDPEEWQKRI
jgi:plasmid stabilization system protein ParE